MFSSVKTFFQARAHRRRADKLFHQGYFDAAADAYTDALALRPALAVVRLNLGLALYKSGHKRQGREEWQTVLVQVEGRDDYLAEQVQILLRQFG